MCLPILFRLYLNKQSAESERREYRTQHELDIELLTLLGKARRKRRFDVLADSAYGGKSVLCQLPPNCDLTSRLLTKARLYELAHERKPGTSGRPLKRGVLFPMPHTLLQVRAGRVTLDTYGRCDRVRRANAHARVHTAQTLLLWIVAIEALVASRYLNSTKLDSDETELKTKTAITVSGFGISQFLGKIRNYAKQ